MNRYLARRRNERPRHRRKSRRTSVTGQWRDSLTCIFDLLVTRAVLAIVTLLLGYFFGKTRTSN